MNSHLKVLGKKLFQIAVSISRRQAECTKVAIRHMVQSTKGRKKLCLTAATESILAAAAECTYWRKNRIWRKAGKTVLKKDPILPPRTKRKPISQRLLEFKAAKEERLKYQIRRIASRLFRTATAGDHYTQVSWAETPVDVYPVDVYMIGQSSKGDTYSKRCTYRRTDSSFTIVVPREWHSTVLPVFPEGVFDDKLVLWISQPTIVNHSHAQDTYYPAKVAVQDRGFSVCTQRLLLGIRRFRSSDEQLEASGKSEKAVKARLDAADPHCRELRRQRQEELNRRLEESLITLRLVQEGKISVENLTQEEKTKVLKAVQVTMTRQKKNIENFGAMGKRSLVMDTQLTA